MRDRVDQLGGRFEAGGQADGGFVRVWLPLRTG
jgi:signal transduction histidine kinase